MLSANFNAIGIGRAYGASAAYGWYWTNTFGSVVDGTYSCTPGDGTVTPPPASTRYVIAGGGRTSSSTSSLLAYDNNTTTSWYTTTSGIPRAAYVYFDLGAVKSVSKVQWYFARTGPADSFRIQVSSDKSSWTTISTRSNGKGAAWESFAWKGQARYVRFYFDNPNKDTVLGYLGEVRIYFLSIAPACLQPSRSAGWTVRPGVVVPGWRL